MHLVVDYSLNMIVTGGGGYLLNDDFDLGRIEGKPENF